MAETAQGVVEEARERYDEAEQADRTNREQAVDDLAFSAGEQWPDAIRKQREMTKRPCLTFNRMRQFVRQVTGDIRKAPPAIRVSPVDDRGDVKLAEIMTGGIRHIEQTSRAHQAYIHAADGAATCGTGSFRLATRYCGEATFDQEPRIERIKNHLSVLWDPYARELDKTDARYCFVSDRVPLAVFKKRYPKAQTSDFDDRKPAARSARISANWWDGQAVTVAEYWRVIETARTLLLMPDGSTLWQDECDPDKLAECKAVAKSTREVMCKRVVSTILNGVEELEEPSEWIGRRIPIFTVMGEEIELDTGTVRRGLIRDMKDPQRMYNFMRTAGVEATALQPKAPTVMTKSMIAGYEAQWKQAQQDNVAYLLFNPDKMWPGGSPQRLMPPSPATGMIAEAQSAIDDMYGASGIYPASLGQSGNETSGKAILARQREGETGTYVYVDNLAQAIAACGRELVYIMPKLYDTERVMRVIGEDGAESWAKLNAMLGRDESGAPVYGTILKPKSKRSKPTYLPTLDAGEYDVVVSAGPTFATKRQEAAEAMMQFAQAAPDLVSVFADLLVKNMDWPGADEMAKRIRKTLPPGMVEPEPDAEPMPQPPPPPPDPALVKAQADTEMAQAKAQADGALAAQKLELDRMKVAADANAKRQQLELDTAKAQADAALETQRLEFEREKAAAQIELETAKLEADITLRRREMEAQGARALVDDDFRAADVQDRRQQHAAPEPKAEPAPASVDATGPALVAAINGMTAAMAAINQPKRVVRDQSGRVSGVEPAN